MGQKMLTDPSIKQNIIKCRVFKLRGFVKVVILTSARELNVTTSICCLLAKELKQF